MRGGGNDDRGGGDWNRQSCGGLRGNRRVPAVTKMARKAVGAATACLYTDTTPILAKLIATTAGTQGFLRHFPHIKHALDSLVPRWRCRSPGYSIIHLHNESMLAQSTCNLHVLQRQ